MSNEAITFSARFGGVAKIYVPVRAMLGIYAKENGQGLFFDPAEYADIEDTTCCSGVWNKKKQNQAKKTFS